jgi:hypothetical protein
MGRLTFALKCSHRINRKGNLDSSGEVASLGRQGAGPLGPISSEAGTGRGDSGNAGRTPRRSRVAVFSVGSAWRMELEARKVLVASPLTTRRGLVFGGGQVSVLACCSSRQP